MWVCGYVCVWVCGCVGMGVWVYGCMKVCGMGVWVLGILGIKMLYGIWCMLYGI
jgi:hypothetical protein